MTFAIPIPEWMAVADCATTDPELFFPPKGGTVAPAKRICAECPVRLQCLDYALTVEQGVEYLFGIWGGATQKERRTMRRPRRCVDCDELLPTAGKGSARQMRCDVHRAKNRAEIQHRSNMRRRLGVTA